MSPLEYYSHLEDLDSESKYLAHKAKEAATHAYAPYSKFCVGAALMLDDGTIVTGANQENAAYPLCMCAERVTLYSSVAQHPEKKVLKLAVVAHKKNHKDLAPATCCGSCRQVLVEFETRQNRPIELIMLGPATRQFFKGVIRSLKQLVLNMKGAILVRKVQPVRPNTACLLFRGFLAELTYVIFIPYSTRQTSQVRLFLLFFEVSLKPQLWYKTLT